jgi:hypothetical protein
MPHDLRTCGPTPIDLATAWAHSMKRCTTGLKVRFFSVTITTGHAGEADRGGAGACNDHADPAAMSVLIYGYLQGAVAHSSLRGELKCLAYVWEPATRVR